MTQEDPIGGKKRTFFLNLRTSHTSKHTRRPEHRLIKNKSRKRQRVDRREISFYCREKNHFVTIGKEEAGKKHNKETM